MEVGEGLGGTNGHGKNTVKMNYYPKKHVLCSYPSREIPEQNLGVCEGTLGRGHTGLTLAGPTGTRGPQSRCGVTPKPAPYPSPGPKLKRKGRSASHWSSHFFSSPHSQILPLRPASTIDSKSVCLPLSPQSHVTLVEPPSSSYGPKSSPNVAPTFTP